MSDNRLLKITHAPVSKPEEELLERLTSQLAEVKHIEEKLKVLWKLDKLDRLSYLAELQRLDKLGELENLQEMENLHHLDSLRHLKELGGLKDLSSLKMLDKLNHLMRLKSLNKLEELQALDQLKGLEKLSGLKELDKLSLLNKLDVLKKIEKLEVLNKVEDLRSLMLDHAEDFQKLDNLRFIEKLENLKKLQSLENLDQLKALDSLSELKNLTDLKDLHKLEKLNKLNELSHLDRLDNLSGLDRLTKLDELRHLEKLENMQDLHKLEYLKDAKVQTAIKGLDKLEFFQDNSKKFFLKLGASVAFDLFKIVAVSTFLLFMFTKNISRQTFDRLVPYLGFGEADRVNIALSILSQDMSSGDFDNHFKNLERRVQREAATVFSTAEKNLDHYRMLENLTAYNYQHQSYDLAAFAKKELDMWAPKVHQRYQDSYEYDVEKTAGRAELSMDIASITKASIFIKQQKYLEALAELDQVKNRREFASLSHGKTYAFFMAFRTKPQELKLYLEKKEL